MSHKSGRGGPITPSQRCVCAGRQLHDGDDMDHGCRDEAEARAWLERSGLPHTFTVHTGRRWDQHDPEKKPEYGLQLYFQAQCPAPLLRLPGPW